MFDKQHLEDCVECGAPLEVYHSYAVAGAGFGPSGSECIVTMERVRCASGHAYHRERSSVEVRPDE